jgi:hypothetical protein
MQHWSSTISTIGVSERQMVRRIYTYPRSNNTNRLALLALFRLNGSNQNWEVSRQSVDGYNSGSYNGTYLLDGTRVLLANHCVQ